MTRFSIYFHSPPPTPLPNEREWKSQKGRKKSERSFVEAKGGECFLREAVVRVVSRPRDFPSAQSLKVSDGIGNRDYQGCRQDQVPEVALKHRA